MATTITFELKGKRFEDVSYEHAWQAQKVLLRNDVTPIAVNGAPATSEVISGMWHREAKVAPSNVMGGVVVRYFHNGVEHEAAYAQPWAAQKLLRTAGVEPISINGKPATKESVDAMWTSAAQRAKESGKTKPSAMTRVAAVAYFSKAFNVDIELECDVQLDPKGNPFRSHWIAKVVYQGQKLVADAMGPAALSDEIEDAAVRQLGKQMYTIQNVLAAERMFAASRNY